MGIDDVFVGDKEATEFIELINVFHIPVQIVYHLQDEIGAQFFGLNVVDITLGKGYDSLCIQ